MNSPQRPDSATFVRMRTDGPPEPLYPEDDTSTSSYQQESFLRMCLRRLPWVLVVALGAVLVGRLIGGALTGAA